ncbi:hypothetical protein ACWC9U_38875 [Streptomyces sp. 900116325]
MAGALEPGRDGARPVFEDIPEPKIAGDRGDGPLNAGAPIPTPQQYLAYIFNADEREDFTVEWVRALGAYEGRPYL